MSCYNPDPKCECGKCNPTTDSPSIESEYTARDAYDSNGNLIYKGSRTMNNKAEILKLGEERAKALELNGYTSKPPTKDAKGVAVYFADSVHHLLGSANQSIVPGERSYLVIDIPTPPDTAERLLREIVAEIGTGSDLTALKERAKKLVAALGEKK